MYRVREKGICSYSNTVSLVTTNTRSLLFNPLQRLGVDLGGGWVPDEAAQSALDDMGPALSFFSVSRQDHYKTVEEGSVAQQELEVSGLCVCSVCSVGRRTKWG